MNPKFTINDFVPGKLYEIFYSQIIRQPVYPKTTIEQGRFRGIFISSEDEGFWEKSTYLLFALVEFIYKSQPFPDVKIIRLYLPEILEFRLVAPDICVPNIPDTEKLEIIRSQLS